MQEKIKEIAIRVKEMRELSDIPAAEIAKHLNITTEKYALPGSLTAAPFPHCKKRWIGESFLMWGTELAALVLRLQRVP